MHRHTIRSSIFVIAMLAASAAFAAFAGADIVKCVGQNGKVTLTDARCDTARVVVEPVAFDAAPAALPDNEFKQVAVQAARHAATRRVAIVPRAVQRDSWTTPRAAKMLSRDIETLKAARLSMQVLDGASASARQQRLARLH
ncbi:DUF4124 domain-containing protein [Massilia psychrophila]|uniref:DUF4124 domain-containing protein n=1 Tax=Massilia psychrophila TaxID=1603353 RepID=A0A2G8SWV4_9BURK|nr:DUF4124 domain-containing protein [Massilia psychrophila]PIL38269.1 hypothetical protein CR103_18855 [Massilia psychrophila]GGE81082.1 hypothetical protein GCM10008020_27370 [Massilia psychrophila]